jgi:hypothetical protein
MDPALTATAIGVGGTVIVGVAGFWANVRNTNKTTALALQGQVTDRYTKAIEQLGSKEIDVRIGGIYALERIARDSERDHPTVMEVLAEFVRDHSAEQWPLPATHEAGVKPPPRETRPDVQAAVTVIGRRTTRDDRQPIHLSMARANLTRAALTRANLTRADLIYADLTGADLTGADLTGATLFGANLSRAYLTLATLTGADFSRADLTGAHLIAADLTYADLTDADLTDATLSPTVRPDAGLMSVTLSRAYLADVDHLPPVSAGPANLTGANLSRANLSRANLIGVTLTGVTLTGADLTGALWAADVAVPKGWQRDTDSGRLKRVGANSGNPPTDPASAV